MSGFFGGGGGSGSATPTTVFQPWGAFDALTGITNLSGANKVQTTGFYLPNSVTFSNIVVIVATSDAGANYDWGIYNTSGSLLAHVGAHSVGATGVVDLAVVGAPITLVAGKYYFAFTGAAATARITRPGGAASSLVLTFSDLTESGTASTGGALPSTIVVPADSWASTLTVHAFSLH